VRVVHIETVGQPTRSSPLRAALEARELTLSVDEPPEGALHKLAGVEANGAFVVDAEGRLLGVVTDTCLHAAINASRRDLAGAVRRDFHAVEPDTVIGDFLHLAGRHVVPITVVDQGRLAGVVPRAAILSALSNARELADA